MGSPIEVRDLVDRDGEITMFGGIDGSAPARRELVASRSIGWAITMLREQGMPSTEIAAILEAGSGQSVRQRLELHRERLEEHLAVQRRTLARLERLLTARSTSSYEHRPQKTKASGN